MNLGAELLLPPPAPDPLAGLDFSAVDLGAVSGRAARGGAALAAGVRSIAGIPYRLDGDGASPAVPLRLAAPTATGAPAVASSPIAVGRTARFLNFLHAAEGPAASPGQTLWEYEVRYAGYDRLIGGEDASSYLARIPVEAGVSVDAWTGAPRVAPALTLDAGDETRHLFVQRWENPQTDAVIAEIVVRSLAHDVCPLVFAVTAATPRPNLLEPGPLDVAPYSVAIGDPPSGLPAGWSASGPSGTVAAAAAPWHDRRALVLAPGGSGERLSLRHDRGVRVPAGSTCRIAFLYRGAGPALSWSSDAAAVRSPIPSGSVHLLPPSPAAWSQQVLDLRVEGDAPAVIHIALSAAGPEPSGFADIAVGIVAPLR